MSRERTPTVDIPAGGFNGTLRVVTSDLLARVAQNRDGTFGGFTARYGVTRLVWYETAPTTADAIAHQKRLERWRRAFKPNLIERDNPTCDDLAIGLGLSPSR